MITHSTLQSPTIMSSFTNWYDVLRAVLVNGYNSFTFDTVVIAGGVATCTRSAGFTNFSTDGVASIAGVTGVFPVLTIAGNVMTLDCTGVANQSLSAVAVKIPGLGYTEYFTGNAGLVVRRGTDNAYFKFVVAGSALSYNAYESMTDFNTGTNKLYPADLSNSISNFASTSRFVFCDDGGQTAMFFGSSVNAFIPIIMGKMSPFLAGDTPYTIFAFNAVSGSASLKFIKNYTGQVSGVGGNVATGVRTQAGEVYPNIEGGVTKEIVTLGEGSAAPWFRRAFLNKINTIPEQLPLPNGYDFLVDGSTSYTVVGVASTAGGTMTFRLLVNTR